MKLRRSLPLLLSIFLIVSLWYPHSEAKDASPLRGQAFSDPAKPTDMPADWQNKPIQHKKEASQVDIAMDINQQLIGFLLPVLQKYEKENNLKISFSKGPCGKSYGMLNRKEIDIGGSCCPIDELDRLPGLQFHTLGIMPLAFLVNSDNPVDGVSFKQLRDIFQGLITNWSQVGGPNQPIKPVSSFHCRVRPGHWRLLLDNEELFGSEVVEVGEMSDMIYHVAKNPWVIGYEVMLVADMFKDRGAVKALKIDGHSPRELSSVVNGEYSVYRTFGVTTWEGDTVSNENAQKLVKYLLDQIEKIGVEKYGLVSAGKLKKTGWKFSHNELISEPE